MIKKEFRYEYSTDPANSYYQILMHPSGNKEKTIDLALMNSHRFAFYYWLKWNKKNKITTPPDLITFDWHQDLAYPQEPEQEELKQLNLENLSEVSLYSLMRLNPLNDNHILSATYINQINDVWVVCKQTPFPGSWEDETITDLNGKIHTIRKFKDKKSLFEALEKSKIDNIFFDIDLDYFTIENSSSNGDRRFTFMKDKEIKEIFNIESEFMHWCFKRMDGFTIALEPEHTGGIRRSLKYLTLLNKIFFEGDLLTWDCKWKHLQ